MTTTAQPIALTECTRGHLYVVQAPTGMFRVGPSASVAAEAAAAGFRVIASHADVSAEPCRDWCCRTHIGRVHCAAESARVQPAAARRAPTVREMADAQFAHGERVRVPGDGEGVVAHVNVHAAGVVTVTLDGSVSLAPFMFFELVNLSRVLAA